MIRKHKFGIGVISAIASLGLLFSGDSQAFEMTDPIAPPGGTPELIGAKPAQPSDWPATFIFRSGTGGCTSTAVGSQSILTAAHCVTDGEVGTVKIGNSSLSVKCSHHPFYGLGNASADFALCKASGPMQGISYEQISTALAYPRINQNVILLGYGCKEVGGSDHTFGVLHTGDTKVVKRPEPNDTDTVTKGGAALCYGDSGGGAYVRFNESGTRRAIFGVNSRGDISTFSFLASTATTMFVDWAFDWASANNTKICGLNIDARGCRP